MHRRMVLAVLPMLLASPLCAHADGPLGIDHRVNYDNSGVWKRSYQKNLAVGAALTVIGGAVFADSDSRIGRTFDQSLDAMVLTAGTKHWPLHFICGLNRGRCPDPASLGDRPPRATPSPQSPDHPSR